jgi:hypothetical protein
MAKFFSLEPTSRKNFIRRLKLQGSELAKFEAQNNGEGKDQQREK